MDEAEREMDDAADSADDLEEEIDEAGDAADKSSGKFEKFGSVLKGIGAAMGAVAVAAGAAAVSLGKEVIAAYADYEQLVGGVDTLFKESSQELQTYAANAYKTAGMSANDYIHRRCPGCHHKHQCGVHYHRPFCLSAHRLPVGSPAVFVLFPHCSVSSLF